MKRCFLGQGLERREVTDLDSVPSAPPNAVRHLVSLSRDANEPEGYLAQYSIGRRRAALVSEVVTRSAIDGRPLPRANPNLKASLNGLHR